MRIGSSFGVRRLVAALAFLDGHRRQARLAPSVVFSFDRAQRGARCTPCFRGAPRWVAVKRRWLDRCVFALFCVPLLCIAAAAADAPPPVPPKLPHAAPQQVGMNAPRLAVIDQLVEEGLQRGEMAGCGRAGGSPGPDRLPARLRPSPGGTGRSADDHRHRVRPGVAHQADRDRHQRHEARSSWAS